MPSTLTIPLSFEDAISTFVKEPRIVRLARVFAGEDAGRILANAKNATSEADFQRAFGCELLSTILARTAKQITVTGIEHFDAHPACLYISNHRDIMLDTALLNSTLIRKGKGIPHIVIGDNLLRSVWLQPFYRLCKAVVVQRELKGKELFEHSLRLSEFVKSAIARDESVWIAQRPGRTKDGMDRTEPALLRMLLLAYERGRQGEHPLLPVTPIAVSYEIEPCDVFKAASSMGARTKNASTDRARNDAANILRGLTQPKGRIALTVRPPILLDNNDARGSTRADKIAELAARVDQEISRGYAVWPTNYIAWDLLHSTSRFSDQYTTDEKQNFIDYVGRRSVEIEALREDAQRALLSLYARPLLTENAHA